MIRERALRLKPFQQAAALRIGVAKSPYRRLLELSGKFGWNSAEIVRYARCWERGQAFGAERFQKEPYAQMATSQRSSRPSSG